MRVFLSFLLVGLLVTPALSTVYWTPEDAERTRELREWGPRDEPLPRAGASISDYLTNFRDAVWFVAGHQVTDPEDPEYGGIREAEHLLDVIQTDNTSESIWMFSRYYELTEDDAILPYLDRSWIYVNTYPAYDEEGTPFPATGYYRYYNCGWALRAGMKYAQVFGDLTHKVYVDSCADYLASHNLSLAGSQFHQDVNPPVLAWAAGNLRRYGVTEGDSLWQARGWKRGERVKEWVNADPPIVRTEEWAMSGGAVMWGVLESYFDEFPAEEADWVTMHASVMDTVASSGDWENAWNGWYALGMKRLQESTGDPIWGERHLALTDYLLGFDTDLDGGIPANPADTDSMDQSWVTSYLGFMCLNPLLLEAVDAPSIGVAATSPFSLLPNHPNPFRPGTTIPFHLQRAEHVVLEVVSPAGRRIARLVDDVVSAGAHRAVWDGRDERGRSVSSGVYFYRLQAGGSSDARKMLRLR